MVKSESQTVWSIHLKCATVVIYKNARCVNALDAKIEKTLMKLKLKALNFKTKVEGVLNILEKTQNWY